MKLLASAFLFLTIGFTASSQCASGDCKNGFGIYKWKDGDRYEGEWNGGKFNGKGAYFYNNGSKFIGIYKQGKKHGEGVFIKPNGNKYEGIWANGKRAVKINTLYKDWLPGKWEGKGYQDNGNTWHVVLNYINKNDIKIKYPSFPCSGVWSFEKENKKQLFFKEKITKGSNKCRPGTSVMIAKERENIMGVYFFQGKKQVASANLVKQ